MITPFTRTEYRFTAPNAKTHITGAPTSLCRAGMCGEDYAFLREHARANYVGISPSAPVYNPESLPDFISPKLRDFLSVAQAQDYALSVTVANPPNPEVFERNWVAAPVALTALQAKETYISPRREHIALLYKRAFDLQALLRSAWRDYSIEIDLEDSVTFAERRMLTDSSGTAQVSARPTGYYLPWWTPFGGTFYHAVWNDNEYWNILTQKPQKTYHSGWLNTARFQEPYAKYEFGTLLFYWRLWKDDGAVDMRGAVALYTQSALAGQSVDCFVYAGDIWSGQDSESDISQNLFSARDLSRKCAAAMRVAIPARDPSGTSVVPQYIFAASLMGFVYSGTFLRAGITYAERQQILSQI